MKPKNVLDSIRRSSPSASASLSAGKSPPLTSFREFSPCVSATRHHVEAFASSRIVSAVRS
jgi:hypothetical protein